MCGRFTLSKPKKIKAKELKVPQADVDLLSPRYNIAPSNNIAVIRNEKERRIESLRWGLIPSWSKDETIGARMINARAETLSEKPSFKGLLNKHRCLVLADGFYEWAEGAHGKEPYFVHLRSGEPFTFAGLWSHWKNPKGEELKTCTIITCAPNALMGNIHNRMPVILEGEAREAWLDPENKEGPALTGLLNPYPERDMEAYPVSKIVNSPQNDSEACLKPLSVGS